ncbi:heme exporter protein CcmB [Carboxydothermus ferrireducens]|uniref:Heme exporter protein B n=1 Tax=Carboxydothermus ferrireducens DSM 11255 TaxID=1119529 RepID=A0ABX2REA1_9THEO|nr:heme exporter protein CcmB [Carboxydothermus ferrireducens]NYE58148.1 heme exporter protein B [Carboxydothermus ferrireducens DSM 11255]
MTFFKKALAIVEKDIKAEFQSKEMLSVMLVFALIMLVIFNFAFDVKKQIVNDIFPGIIWITFFFSGLLGLNRSFFIEKNQDCLLGLMLAPVDRSVIFLGKMLSNLVFLLIIEILTLPLFFIFLNIPVPQKFGFFLIILFFGSLGFVAIGTFLAALAANTRASDILLPVLLFPVLIPVILGSVAATKGVFFNLPFSEWSIWLKILGVYDLLFIVVPLMLFETLLEV